jgi:soluble lytic murein transglycosylase-like protein
LQRNCTSAEIRRMRFGKLLFAATGGRNMYRDKSNSSPKQRFPTQMSMICAVAWMTLTAGQAMAQSSQPSADRDVVARWSRDLLAKAEGHAERAITAQQIVQRSLASADASNAEALDPTKWPAAYANVIHEHAETLGVVRPVHVQTGADSAERREYAWQPETSHSVRSTALRALEPAIRRVLRMHGLPEHLVAVPLIESGFNPRARSPKGALGLWQLMPDTARRFGLKVNRDVDERFDPILSTYAAARYLQELYGSWRDWELALAAYNAGEGRVASALNSSSTASFSELSRRQLLPEETRNYVPAVLRAAQAIKSRPEVRASSDVISGAQDSPAEALAGGR